MTMVAIFRLMRHMWQKGFLENVKRHKARYERQHWPNGINLNLFTEMKYFWQ